MRFVYLSSGTEICATIDEGESLASSQGPVVLSIPALPENAHFAEMQRLGLEIEPFEPPAPAVPLEIQRHQGLIALLLEQGITERMIRDKMEEIEGLTDRELTRIRLEQPTWQRHSEFITWGAFAFGLSSEQVDQLFISAASA
ncbi:hypothetical protein [Bosea sp. BK604]|uniref:hypothetical protein n=1 Tax=Bosea sp. BK604 TaxID=2512180 RepID=UPI0010438C97|nr:hypothetical protein [Bosea sp. BK604]TCR65432.1 hypothetical protein EV560_105195 [Bosea sp. BK604]